MDLHGAVRLDLLRGAVGVLRFKDEGGAGLPHEAGLREIYVAEGVPGAVSQDEADHVLARQEQIREIVLVEIDDMVHVGGVGREQALGDLPSVDEKTVESEAGEGESRLPERFFERKAPSHERRGKVLGKRAYPEARADEFSSEYSHIPLRYAEKCFIFFILP